MITILTWEEDGKLVVERHTSEFKALLATIFIESLGFTVEVKHKQI